MLSVLQRLLPPLPDNLLLLKMPLEIIEEIIEWLAIEDRACLALTCKFLFFRYCSVHKALELRTRRPVANKKPVLCPNAEKKLPVRFLRRLENSRWKLCLECWKLHPRTKNYLPWKHHCHDCYVLYGGRCVLDTGVVDICPCLTVTYRDLRRLIESVESLLQSRNYDGEKYYENVLSPDHSSQSYARLIHRCEITDHPKAKAEIITTIYLVSEARLVVMNHYRFKSFVSTACLSARNHSSICPRENTSKWLQSFFKDVGDGFTGYRRCFWRCSRCRSATLKTNSESESFEVFVTRTLGTGKGSDLDWKHNCRHEGPSWDQRLRLVCTVRHFRTPTYNRVVKRFMI
jgi:hypothetical protein